MALSADDKQDIVDAIIKALQPSHQCGLCKDNPEAAKEMQHVMGFIKDIGDGDIAAGIEKLRTNSKWTLAVREAVKMSRVEVLKIITKMVILATGAGLVLLFGEKIMTAWKG